MIVALAERSLVLVVDKQDEAWMNVKAGKLERATKRKDRPKFRVATVHGVYGVERSFPLYAPACTNFCLRS